MQPAKSRQVLSLHQIYKDSGMDFIEATTHPFIVRIWLEEPVEESSRASWRGHITHVPSGERHYLESLDEIIAFIAPYLEDMGVNTGITWKARQWMKRIKADLKGNSQL